MYKTLLITCGFLLQAWIPGVSVEQVDTESASPGGIQANQTFTEALNVVSSRRALKADNRCGYQTTQLTKKPKIVGGKAAGLGEYPWQVSLQILSSRGGYDNFCGGALISRRWVLTAGHCLTYLQPAVGRIVLGSVNLKQLNSAVVGRVRRTVRHPNYNERTIENDIGLVELDRDIDLSERSSKAINSICLPSPNQKFTGDVIATGFGRLTERGPSSSELQQVTLELMDTRTCRRYYGSLVRAGMICAGYAEGKKDACQGDSGGPLVQKEGNRSTLVGIVSWGVGCAQPEQPGVYTEVSEYVGWINRVTSM